MPRKTPPAARRRRHRWRGFNEAAAHAAENPPASGAADGWGGSFNEAAAHAAENHILPKATIPPEWMASMRPRPMPRKTMIDAARRLGYLDALQ